MEKQYDIKAKYDWIKIIYKKVEKYKYGFRGEIAWNTERNPEINRISSIHLEQSKTIKYLFEMKKVGNY